MLDVEWKKINGSDNMLLEFYQYWTRKEAVLKATGKGLEVPLKSFLVEKNKTIINDTNFYIQSIEVEKNYCCNIAVKSNFNNLNNVSIKQVFI